MQTSKRAVHGSHRLEVPRERPARLCSVSRRFERMIDRLLHYRNLPINSLNFAYSSRRPDGAAFLMANTMAFNDRGAISSRRSSLS